MAVPAPRSCTHLGLWSGHRRWSDEPRRLGLWTAPV